MNKKKEIQKKYRKEIDIFNKVCKSICRPVEISFRVQATSKDIGGTLVIKEEKEFDSIFQMERFLDNVLLSGFNQSSFSERIKEKLVDAYSIGINIRGYDKDNDYVSYEWKFGKDIDSFLHIIDYGLYYEKGFLDKLMEI